MPISFGRQIPAEYSHHKIIGDIKAEEWDGFHDFVLWDELYRGGAISSIFVGLTVGEWSGMRFESVSTDTHAQVRRH